MAINICIYEDSAFRQFFPLTYLRPVFALRAGVNPLYNRLERFFSDFNLCLAVREQLAFSLTDNIKGYPINIIKRETGDLLFVNGRIREYGNLPGLVSKARISTVFKNNGEIIAVLLKDDIIKSVPAVATTDIYLKLFEEHRSGIPQIDTSANLYNYCWEIVSDVEKEITTDIEFLKNSIVGPKNLKIHEGVYLLNEEEIYFGDDLVIYPDVVINAEHGPVWIGVNTIIEPDVTINGPVYIGPNSVVLAGKISASSIGHTCRVGGEVEESIFQSYVNKYHAGFIGHSYIGSWVNFGAITTNSDLKNNYSSIRLSLNNKTIDSGLIKVGSFVGDHTKFGIGTLLNTGINIGVCCNIFGGALITEKEVPSFSWGNSSGYDRYDFEKAIQTAQMCAGRRNVKILESETNLLRAIFDNDIRDNGIIEFK